VDAVQDEDGEIDHHVTSQRIGDHKSTLTSRALRSSGAPYCFIAKPPRANGVFFNIGATTSNNRSASRPYM
jgi:hypothetical protein